MNATLGVEMVTAETAITNIMGQLYVLLVNVAHLPPPVRGLFAEVLREKHADTLNTLITATHPISSEPQLHQFLTAFTMLVATQPTNPDATARH